MGLELSREGEIFVLCMDAGENRFTPDSIRAWNDALDRVEKAGAPCGLVTVGTGKFYSNGLDLDHMMGASDPGAYLAGVLGIFARVLTLPAVSVAALNGHAFGAGGQVALAHDFRVMRADRGYFCMPEVDMKAPLHPGMTALLRARLPAQTVHEMIATGKRWGGAEACARGIVGEALAKDRVLPRALELASELAAKADPAMAVLKRGMYGPVLDALAQPLGPLGARA